MGKQEEPNSKVQSKPLAGPVLAFRLAVSCVIWFVLGGLFYPMALSEEAILAG